MRRVSLGAVAVALMLASAITLSPARPAVAISPGGYCVEPEEAAMLTLINQYRAQNGLGTLTLSQTVGAAAEHHSADMATYNYFSHTLANGEKWSDNMRDHGYTYNTFRGENIAAGNADAYSTFVQWQNSPGHNANMLNPNYTVIGIGRVVNGSSSYGYYWTTDFGGYVDGMAVYCGQNAPALSQPQQVAAPQQPAPARPSNGGRAVRGSGGGAGGGSTGGSGGGVAAPAPGPAPTPRPSTDGRRSIRH